MKIHIIEKDKETIDLLQHVIKDNEIAEAVHYSDNYEEALSEIMQTKPEIIITALTIERQDGLSFVKELKEALPHTYFIVISNILAKDIAGKTYKCGAEYYVVKPVDYLEIESILYRVREKIEIISRLNQIKKLLSMNGEETLKEAQSETLKITKAMQKLGILGESGCKDILSVLNYLISEGKTMADYTLREICELFSENPKTMEQRIRRAAAMGMVNVANLGIEDYMNETFMEYSNGLYNFEQVKLEMDYIRKKGKKRGMVNIKKFLDNMLYYAKS